MWALQACVGSNNDKNVVNLPRNVPIASASMSPTTDNSSLPRELGLDERPTCGVAGVIDDIAHGDITVMRMIFREEQRKKKEKRNKKTEKGKWHNEEREQRLDNIKHQ